MSEVKNLLTILDQAGLSSADVMTKTADIALMPDEPACPIWMRWEIVHIDVIKGMISRATKYKSGREIVDEEKLAKYMIERCCKSIENLTFNAVRESGLLAMTKDVEDKILSGLHGVDVSEVVKWNDEERETRGEKEFEGNTATAVWLSKESRAFRQRMLELQTVQGIIFAEDTLRKKRSAVTSGKESSEETAQ